MQLIFFDMQVLMQQMVSLQQKQWLFPILLLHQVYYEIFIVL